VLEIPRACRLHPTSRGKALLGEVPGRFTHDKQMESVYATCPLAWISKAAFLGEGGK